MMGSTIAIHLIQVYLETVPCLSYAYSEGEDHTIVDFASEIMAEELEVVVDHMKEVVMEYFGDLVGPWPKL
jgi:hypothetical protein